jgi:type II secretory pathway component PulC
MNQSPNHLLIIPKNCDITICMTMNYMIKSISAVLIFASVMTAVFGNVEASAKGFKIGFAEIEKIENGKVIGFACNPEVKESKGSLRLQIDDEIFSDNSEDRKIFDKYISRPDIRASKPNDCNPQSFSI